MFNFLFFDKTKLLLPLIFFSVISFEITLYPYYSMVSMASFFCILLFLIYNYKVGQIRKKYWLFIFSYIFFSLMVSFYYFNSLGLIRAIFTFFSFFLCHLFVFNKIDFLRFYYYISFIPLGFSYFLQIKKEVLLWGFVDGRNASFMFDPNYCGVFFASSALISLIIFNSNKSKWGGFLLFFIGLLFTFSKGALLALFAGFLFYLYCNYYLKSIFYLIFFASVLFAFFLYSGLDLTLYRVEQGFNSRDGFFLTIINHVFYNGNYMGGGDGVLEKLLSDNYFDNHSTHNFYLDLLVTNGIIPLIILIFFIAYVGVWGFKNRSVYLSLFVLLFVASNSVSISLGGVGILSLVFTYSAVMVLNKFNKVE